MNRKHTETMINSFTLSQLIEMSGDNRQGLIRECFTASSDNRMEIFRFPCRIDASSSASARKAKPAYRSTCTNIG